MVKGVNKKVIEINNTENEFFEKIVLYVSPKAGATNSAKVKKAVNDVVSNLSAASPKTRSLREIVKMQERRKKRFKILLLCIASLLVLSGILFLL